MLSFILFVVLVFVLILAFLDYLVRSIRVNSKISFEGAHVLITGGSSGIGLALAKICICQGSNVTLVARNMARLNAAKEEVERHKKDENQQVLCVSVDICEDFGHVETSLNEVCNQLGPVDILVNCAGFAISESFLDTPPDGFKNMMETNYLGSVYVTKCIAPKMVERRHGHIVLVSSMGGQLGVYGYSAYTPSKFAVRGFAEVLFAEIKPYNVGVSVVFPPDTNTPGYEVENRSKPEATRIISEQGGVFSSDEVAQSIASGIKKRQFLISCGFDGHILTTLTCGAAVSSSFSELIGQVLLMGPLRVIMTCYTLTFDRIIERCIDKITQQHNLPTKQFSSIQESRKEK